MKFARPGVLLALVFALPGLAGAAEGTFFLKEGDRVVFYGDSITEQRLYTAFAETYAVTRFPKLNLRFVHSGWGGDRVTGGGGGPIDVRLDRDVVAYKPTVVTVMLGMNDASYKAFDDKVFKTYADGYKHIVEKLKTDLPGVRLTLVKPSPYDDVTRKAGFEGGYNSVLLRYGDFVHELAEQSGSGFADLNTLVVEATRKAYEIDPEGAVKLNPDRVHPGPGGQLLMAYALLKAWDAPSLVSSVAIDARGDREKPMLAGAENAAVTELAGGESIRWTQLDEALPFPINLKDAPTALAVRSSDIVMGLDRQFVKVAGLDAEAYTLSVDDKSVGEFTSSQLAEGVNLATLATPMLEQATLVYRLTIKRGNAHNQRWRMVQVAYQEYGKTPGYTKAIEGFDALEAEIQVEQHATAQPRPHKFELKPRS